MMLITLEFYKTHFSRLIVHTSLLQTLKFQYESYDSLALETEQIFVL
jgi:hypothetical protein